LPANGGKRPEKLRDELRWLGFGQAGPGAFAHPNGNLAEVRGWLRALDLGGESLVLRSASGDAAVDRGMVAAGWDLIELARRYRRFIDSFAAARAALDSSGSSLAPEAAFIIRTLLIHDYRKIHLRDPLLPPALLPKDWVGSNAYELCGDLYSRVFAAAEDFLTATASTLEQRLPPAEAAAYQRFGG
jgi:phenylacetic acid degradation operon negative regulatory protein